MFALFIREVVVGLVLLNEVWVVSLPLEENLTLRFSFKEVPVRVTRRRLPIDVIELEMVDYSMILGIG